MPLIRVTFVQNGDFRNARVVVTQSDFDSLVKAATNKLRYKVKRLFLPDGNELTRERCAQLTDGAVVACSKGENFACVTVSQFAQAEAALSNGPPPTSDGNGASTNALEAPSTANSTSPSVPIPAVVRVVANKSDVEEEAVRQLEAVARLEGVCVAVGLPDVHPGKGYPVGSAVASSGVIYPMLIGDDIGCGMALHVTSLPARRAHKANKWADALRGLDEPYDAAAVAEILRSAGVAPSKFDSSLGTIGAGNHFAELQSVERVVERELFDRLGLSEDKLCLLVHSGSRGLGRSVLSWQQDTFGTTGLPVTRSESESERRGMGVAGVAVSEGVSSNANVVDGSRALSGEDGTPFEAYMRRHDDAMKWARCNRELIARRFLDALAASSEKVVLDVFHNFVEERSFAGNGPLWLHRKGAAPADRGAVVIPGSRGAASYLVMPAGESETELSAYSLAHGAGRKWTRSKALATGRDKYPDADSLRTTPLGSVVVCDSKELLYEEAPDAYKGVGDVVVDLVEANLCRIVAILKPVVTYKTRGTAHATH